MTEKNDYNAKIRGKGLENTGVTEDLARSMYNTLGRSTLAIVRLTHKRQINDDDTGRTVELTIDMVEPSVSDVLDKYLENLVNTMHQNRVLKSDDQQLQIDTLDDVEPTVEQVIAAGQQHLAQTDDPLPDGEDEDDDQGDDGDVDAEQDQGDDPWEYPAPEGTHPDAATVPDPFATTPTGPGPDAA